MAQSAVLKQRLAEDARWFSGPRTKHSQACLLATIMPGLSVGYSA